MQYREEGKAFAILAHTSESVPKIENNTRKKLRKDDITKSERLNLVCISIRKKVIHFDKAIDGMHEDEVDFTSISEGKSSASEELPS